MAHVASSSLPGPTRRDTRSPTCSPFAPLLFANDKKLLQSCAAQVLLGQATLVVPSVVAQSAECKTRPGPLLCLHKRMVNPSTHSNSCRAVLQTALCLHRPTVAFRNIESLSRGLVDIGIVCSMQTKWPQIHLGMKQPLNKKQAPEDACHPG